MKYEIHEGSHAHETRICQKFISQFPREIDMYRLRVGKTIYCFDNIQRMKIKIKQLDTINFDIANPGETLPAEKLKLR